MKKEFITNFIELSIYFDALASFVLVFAVLAYGNTNKSIYLDLSMVCFSYIFLSFGYLIYIIDKNGGF